MLLTTSQPFPAGHGGPAFDSAVAVARRLQDAGFTAYWAGGCVRDMIMGREPKDYDIATGARPDEVLALFPRAVAVGKSFGVVRVEVEPFVYEVATFRRDEAYHDGRHPETVTFAEPEEDAQRRDFTVNALFYDPMASTILDYIGGMADIRRRLLRAVGDPNARFREDHLRMLRAVRFAATLEFSLDPATAEAIRAAAPLLPRISSERIHDEMTRILTESVRPGQAIALLQELGILAVILPEVSDLANQAQSPDFHPEGDVFRHTTLMLDQLQVRDARLAWASLLHDVGKPPTAQYDGTRWRFERHAPVGAEAARAILDRLRFSRDDEDTIVHMIGNHMRFGDVARMRRSTLRRLVGHPAFPLELELHRMDCLASHGKLNNYDRLVAFQQELAAEVPLPAPWIRGEDVMALGIPEGRQVGAWCRRAYDLQLENRYGSREEILAWLRQAVADAAGGGPAPEGSPEP